MEATVKEKALLTGTKLSDAVKAAATLLSAGVAPPNGAGKRASERLPFPQLVVTPPEVTRLVKDIEAKIATLALPDDQKKKIQSLIKQLGDDNYQKREAANEALIKMGPKTIPELKAAVAEFKSAKKNHKPYDLQTRRSAEILLDHWENPNESYMNTFSTALVKPVADLGKFGIDAESAVPALHKLLHLTDSNKDLTLNVVKTLGAIGPQAGVTVPHLSKILSTTSDSELRGSIIQSFGMIGPNAKAAIPAINKIFQGDASRDLKADIVRTYGLIGEASTPALIEALKDKDYYIRRDAAKMLGFVKPKAKEAVTALITAFDDRNHTVRADAIEALTRIKPEAKVILPVLIKSLKTEDYIGIVKNEFELLGKYGREAASSTQVIIDSANKTGKINPSIHIDAANALGKIGVKSKETLSYLNGLVAEAKGKNPAHSWDDQQIVEAGKIAADALKKFNAGTTSKKGASR